MMRKTMTAVVGMMMAIGSLADVWTDPKTGLAWTYQVLKDGSASIGGGSYGSPAIPTSTIGAVEIPFEINGKTVTSIGGYAFFGCDGLTSVIIPEGVTSIETASFAGCSDLTSVTIPSSLTKIDNMAFFAVVVVHRLCVGDVVLEYQKSYGCGVKSIVVAEENPRYKSKNGLLLTKDGLTVVQGVNGDVSIPEGVTSIGDCAFACRSELTSIMIPESVTNIGDRAFFGCGGLTSITIPHGVVEVGDHAFDCSLLDKSVQVDEKHWWVELDLWGVTNFNFEAEPPLGLSSACIDQDSVIRYRAVYEDEWLPVIEECGFTNASPDVPKREDGGPYTETVDGIEWTFMVTNGESVIKRAPNTISGDVTIPSVLGGRTVVGIAPNAIHSCHNLNSVTIPSSVTEIGASVFYMCPNLSDVTFEGDMVESVGKTAFDGCHWDLIIHVPSTWTGRGKTLNGLAVERAGESETVNNVNLTITNVVVQYVLNSVQPEIAVPVSPDTGFVTAITEVKSSGAVSVPSEWSANYPSFTTRYGSDFGKALMKKSGKKDGAGNDMLVWQDFVAGTDPTDENDTFTASITVVDGVPVVSYTPELTAEQKALRTYKTFGKKQLQDAEWTDITDLDGEGKKPYNFFKVTVEMK